MSERKISNVHIGEVCLGKPGSVLKATLGSCLGIGFVWKERNLYGLAHCLLPKSPKSSFEIGAQYVDQGVSSLIRLMKLNSDTVKEIDCFIAGGGNMTMPRDTPSERLVGDQNANNARLFLKEAGVRIVEDHTGGCNGVKIIIDCTGGAVEVERIPRFDEHEMRES